ncbi:carbon storage regulator CsrA [Arthrobacter sp. MSA 4-2]|uniref:carbon storage regulator CsrA n=1 Tax=Arthrobacter sp. MSA 4-2 TaxID=2794349 RepID=UPI0018E89B31|nr:carbon storage regulator CsrA [Arthrobacter sp. MSA 4-2]MBJ2120565.1 carbon storage regulator CsrA [Arthrobacter sp. MSA 4-2]
MLVLTRKFNEKIHIGEDIVITILESRGDGIKIGIEAPRGVKIQRGEILQAVIEANLSANVSDADAEFQLKALLGRRDPEPDAGS